MINFLGKRYYFFAFSLLIIIPGMILASTGLPLAIDFTGGSMLEVRFDSGRAPLPGEVHSLYEELGVTDIQVSSSGQDVIIARSSFLDDATRGTIVASLENRFNDTVTLLRFESVGPTISQQVANRAAGAVAVATIAILLYITFAFRGVPNAFRYGVCAIIAMAHDVAIVVSLGAIGGLLWGWQIDALFLTALLTVIGFSVHDMIVVFDRVRENSHIYKRLPYEILVNHSIVQTLQRSINTQLMTVMFMLLALVLMGGVTLRQFGIVLLVGLFSGMYSSLFIASPLLIVWENKEWKNWFRRSKKNKEAVA
jgi:preprotein translocase subunit SecF